MLRSILRQAHNLKVGVESGWGWARGWVGGWQCQVHQERRGGQSNGIGWRDARVKATGRAPSGEEEAQERQVP